MATTAAPVRHNIPDPAHDWARVAYLVQLSRALDVMEETRLVPEKKVLYQFSARGHDMAQILLGLKLTDRKDATCGYYRSRPMLLSLGVIAGTWLERFVIAAPQLLPAGAALFTVRALLFTAGFFAGLLLIVLTSLRRVSILELNSARGSE